MEYNARRIQNHPQINIKLPNQFTTAIRMINENSFLLNERLDSTEYQIDGIPSDAIFMMLDNIEVATRLARSEAWRAVNYQRRENPPTDTPAARPRKK